ncbi:MAG: TIGR04086 family membrane protein [Oscillospiraceae bacterium]|nr:TIGR04086 family membrane protein [Oscillospiraceae bacterium]
MRKAKRDNRAKPFIIGLIFGYAVTGVICVLSAAVLSLTDSASTAAGAAAAIALSVGSFICGKTAGILRRRNGMKTGAVCGVLFVLPVTVLSLIFSGFGGGLILKIGLCAAFGTVGGVAGVNKEEHL